MVKFEENDYKDWEKFRLATTDVITNVEFTLVCKLHSKYYNHTFYKPCTCSPKIVKRWIKDLNLIFDNER